MKKWIVLMGFAGLALGVSADILQQWTFDEAAGSNISAAQNSGTPGDASWSWQSTADRYRTDGNGNLECIPGGSGYSTASFGTALSGSDTYSFEVVVSAWNAVSGSCNLQSKLGSAVEIYSQVDATDGLMFTFRAGGNYQTYRTVGGNALSGTTQHKARIDFNIAAGTAAYFVDDVDITGSWLNLTGLTIDNASSMILQKSGDFPTADPATVLLIDSQSLSVIPEPATLGLVSAIGIALLAVRRFFII